MTLRTLAKPWFRVYDQVSTRSPKEALYEHSAS